LNIPQSGYEHFMITNAPSSNGPSPVATTPASGDSTANSAYGDQTHVVTLTRKRIDRVLIGMGLVSMVVLLVAASLLTWGSSFSRNYVRDELGSQRISFGNAASLTQEGRQDLLKYADAKLDTGQEAQAYASYINGHLKTIGGGQTFADLGTPERAAKAKVQEAKDASQPQATIDALQADATKISQTRDTLFKGETLRGLLLSAYAWSTVGRIAGLAAIGAIIAAGLMAILVIFGINHLRTSNS
jgi:hypothetical protein